MWVRLRFIEKTGSERLNHLLRVGHILNSRRRTQSNLGLLIPSSLLLLHTKVSHHTILLFWSNFRFSVL